MSSDEDISDEESGGIPSESDSDEDDEGGIPSDSESDDDDEDIGTTADTIVEDGDMDSEEEEEEQTKGWFKQIEEEDDDDEEEEGEEVKIEESPLDQSRRLVDEILTEIEKKFEEGSESKDWEIVLKLFPEMTKIVEKCKKLSGHPPSNYIVQLHKFIAFLEKKKEKEERNYFHELSKRSKKALSQFRNILNKEAKLYSRAIRDYKRNSVDFLKKDLGREKKVVEEVKKKWWLKGVESDSDSDDEGDDEELNDAWLEEEDSGEEEDDDDVVTDNVEGTQVTGKGERPKISTYLHERIAWNDELIEKKLDEYGLNVINVRHERDLLDMFEATKLDDLKIRIQMLLLNIAINQHKVNWYECCYRMLDIIDRIEANPDWEFYVGAKVPDKQLKEPDEETEGEDDKENPKTVIPIICEFFVFVRTIFRGYVSLLQNTDRNTMKFIEKLSHERIILNILERYFRHYEKKFKFRYSQDIGLNIMYILHTRLEKDHEQIIIKRNIVIAEKLQKIKEKEEMLRKKKEEEEEERKRKEEEEEEEAKEKEGEEEEEDVLEQQPPLEEGPKGVEEEDKKEATTTTDSDLLEEDKETTTTTTTTTPEEPKKKEEEEEEKKKEEEGEGEEEEDGEKEGKEDEDLENPFLPKIVLQMPNPPLVLASLNKTFRDIRDFVLKTRGFEDNVIASSCYLICTCSVNNRFVEAKHLYLSHQRKFAHFFLSHHQRDRRDGSRSDHHDKKVKKEVSEQLKVLYNRTLTQFGMCAFRCCEFVDCCTILGDLHGNSQKKQLLSQALVINPRTGRVEKSKLWPYHMTINLDNLESYYLISLILLEIPIRKFVPFLHSKTNFWQDQSRGIFLNKRKRVRSFRNYATYYSRQIYSAPPKTTRELVFKAVKYILERNDWKNAFDCLKRLECWKYTKEMEGLNEKIQNKLLYELKKTSVRNYLHRSGDIYDKLSVEFMTKKFELTKKQIIQIVSDVIIKDGWSARIGGENKEWVVLKQKNRKFNWSIYHSLNERSKSVNGDIFNVQ